MLEMVNDTLVIGTYSGDIGTMLTLAAKYGVTCTLPETMNQLVIVCCLVGMAIGVACTLLFQYTRRKTAERIAEAERDTELEALKK